MAILARKYLTVQGTSTPPERVISRLGIVLSKSRQAMSGPAHHTLRGGDRL